tara:strand:+ start:1292 stop:1504 length:213 start_codon:yes stop_codon:yes gene_type:complete
MGSLFGTKYQETEQDKLIKRQMKEEEEAKAKKIEDEKKRKLRIAAGMVGPRSLMTRAGGSGMFNPEGEKY